MRSTVIVLTVIHSSFDSHGIGKVSPRYGDTPNGQEIVFNAWILQTVIRIEQITMDFLGQQHIVCSRNASVAKEIIHKFRHVVSTTEDTSCAAQARPFSRKKKKDENIKYENILRLTKKYFF